MKLSHCDFCKKIIIKKRIYLFFFCCKKCYREWKITESEIIKELDLKINEWKDKEWKKFGFDIKAWED